MMFYMIKLANLSFAVILCLLTFSEVAGQHPDNEKFDVLIQNACVFDGTGRDSMFVDVGIRADRIVFVGEPKHAYQADRIINAQGLYLTPGFIDPHSHYNKYLSDENSSERALMRCLRQGVTTVFTGNDGAGPWPIGETLDNWEKLGVGVNVGLFVPHGTVRTKVIGFRNIGASLSQLDKMKDMVEAGMEDGGFGLSTGLFYTPGTFAKTEEVIELAKVAAAYGGIYDTHQRDEGDQNTDVGVINSIKEVLEIGEKANIPVHISHIKTTGTSVWGKSNEIIKMVEEAQRKGINVSANQYPYLAARAYLRSWLLPVWVREGGYEAMRRRLEDPQLKDSVLHGIRQLIAKQTGAAERLHLSTTTHELLDGKTLADVAEDWGIPVEDAVLRIALSEESRMSVLVHSFSMSEEDMLNFMVQPWVMTGSDGDLGHPRAFGTFARILREYTLDRHLFSMAYAVYRSSGLTAATLNVKDRGVIKEGYFADVVLFDPNEIKDNATYENGEQLASGVCYVIVNGELTIDNGKYTGALAGKSLRLN